jgi:hypothetical protein
MPARDPQLIPDGAVRPAVTPGAVTASESRGRSADELRRGLALAAVLTIATCVFGLVTRADLVATGMAEPRAGASNIFYRLFALHEAPFLWVAAGFAALVALRARPIGAMLPALSRPVKRLGAAAARVPLWCAALGVLVTTLAGTFAVMHGIGLSMDEAAASFQARIFTAGRVAAPIPPAWHGLAPWMTPIFVTLKPAEHAWISAYLPVYAALRAPFAAAHAEWLLNPALAALTVVLLAVVCNRLWPADARQGRLAVVFLLTSAQFLITSMSGYSMPAHLCLNLFWLYLYLRDDGGARLALPWAGVLALGLHNPFPHALFAAPFLLRVVLRRRFGWAAYYAVVYLAGAAAWYHWLRFAAAPTAAAARSTSSLVDTFTFPSGHQLVTQALNLGLIISWQTPVLFVLALAAVIAWRRLSATERDLAWGVALTISLYVFFPANQGHGWGYRYVYGVLGSLVLLGARGASLLAHVRGDAAMQWLVTASAAVSIAVQLPLRASQVSSVVRPHAAALEFIAARPEKLVLVDVTAAWYASDLVRNDPLFGRGPRTAALLPGHGPGRDLVPDSIAQSTYVLGPAELARLGLHVPPPRLSGATRP